jgi:glycerol-3-phosphate acyltransferase PlsY
MSERLGGGWAALAATLDVAKGMVYPLAARRFGHLPDSWLAMAGVAVVVGHSFPFYARPMAGRGLAATAGVYLALLPVEMVIAGAIMLAGIIARTSGIASTVGFGGVPLVAWIQGQPVPFVAMGAAIFAVILIRRLEGVGTVVEEAHVSWPRAILWRTVFDTSGQPSETREPEVKGREA